MGGKVKHLDQEKGGGDRGGTFALRGGRSSLSLGVGKNLQVSSKGKRSHPARRSHTLGRKGPLPCS